MTLYAPDERLKDGAKVLLEVLATHGFTFQVAGSGTGSGGEFARGDFTKPGRRLEIHVRQGLGLVTYHAGAAAVSHEAYMAHLGVMDRCRYPGFSDDPLQAFHDLAHDLGFAADFLSGDASMLIAAAAAENTILDAQRDALSTGQHGELERMRENFWAGRYREVVDAYAKLSKPHLLTDAQVKMVELARKRARRHRWQIWR